MLIQLVVSGRTAAFNHHSTPTTASDAMTSIACRMGAAEECRSLRVLCLHGKGGNGEQFTVSSLAPLREMVERRLRGTDATVEWHHLTGPFRLNEEDVSAGHAWWTLRPGERSFNAKEVRLLMKMVDDCMLLTAFDIRRDSTEASNKANVWSWTNFFPTAMIEQQQDTMSSWVTHRGQFSHRPCSVSTKIFDGKTSGLS